MKRIQTALIAMGLLLTVALTGFAKDPIVFVTHSGLATIKRYEELFDQFTAETGIEVEIMKVDSDIVGKWEQIYVRTAAGISPDVVSNVSLEFAEYAMKGLLEPLDPMIERSGLGREDLLPIFTEALQLDGVQYMMPYGGSVYFMAYNKDHFNESGLANPPKDWDSSRWTWDDFVNTAKKLTVDSAQGTERWGIIGSMIVNTWQTAPNHFGGDWISDDLTTFLGAEEEAVSALQEIADLEHVHGVRRQGGRDLFATGVGSMYVNGSWIFPSMVDANINWDFMPWFSYKGNDPAGVVFPVGHGVLSASKKKEEAWELVKWLTWNDDANLEFSLAANAFPVRISNLPRWIEEQFMNFPDVSFEVLIPLLERYSSVTTVRKTPAFSKIDPIMREAVSRIMRNQTDARTAMESVEGTINELIKESFEELGR